MTLLGSPVNSRASQIWGRDGSGLSGVNKKQTCQISLYK